MSNTPHTCYTACWDGVPGELAVADCPACSPPAAPPTPSGCSYPGCSGGYVQSGGIIGMLQVCSCCRGTVHRTGDPCQYVRSTPTPTEK
jgi:hypothetical protein